MENETLNILKIIQDLFNKNKELEAKINKAIEYIKQQELLYYSGSKNKEKYSKYNIDLLEILKEND